MFVLLVYGFLVIALSFFGAKELLGIKFGRLGIAIVGYFSALILNMRLRYATNIIFALWLAGVGTINTIALSKTGGEVTYSGWAGELIGSENTMAVFVTIMGICNNANFSVMVLWPILLIINAAMLYNVTKEIEDDKSRMIKTMNVCMRIINLTAVLLAAQIFINI